MDCRGNVIVVIQAFFSEQKIAYCVELQHVVHLRNKSPATQRGNKIRFVSTPSCGNGEREYIFIFLLYFFIQRHLVDVRRSSLKDKER